ncbi:MAG: HAD family hydrolase [Deltaproteobacteria bacterium]
MLKISLPGREQTLELENLLLDQNGTITEDGVLLPGVAERVAKLRENMTIYLLTADTFGSAAAVAEHLEISLFKVSPEQGGADKKDFLMNLDAAKTAAIGNGFNDALMLEEAALSIAVIGPEGCAVSALKKADIVVNDINDALDLFINPLRLVATLRA